MEKEDKDLLLKDLCGRLPYGVKGECKLDSTYSVDMIFRYHCFDAELVGIKNDGLYVHPLIEHHAGYEFANKEVADGIGFDNFKPYLRPMSSMTEEEKKEYEGLFENVHWVTSGLEDIGILSIDFMECYDNDGGIRNIYDVIPTKAIDWLNAHHFDYRGLIPKGLAIEAKEGMYNF